MSKNEDRSRGFVARTYAVGQRYPAILPPIFSLEEMRRDIEVTNGLQSFLLVLNQLRGQVQDTLIAARSDACNNGLAIYSYARAHANEAGLKGAVEEMGKLFVRRRVPKNESSQAVKPNNTEAKDSESQNA
ncbi:MAG: hypothetical protein ACKV2V_10480 [Blastocatellia bacterium]